MGKARRDLILSAIFGSLMISVFIAFFSIAEPYYLAGDMEAVFYIEVASIVTIFSIVLLLGLIRKYVFKEEIELVPPAPFEDEIQERISKLEARVEVLEEILKEKETTK